ncbi:MAG: hypothetical protein GY759_20920 [Chloroflexi bacterium]|nr:hypothetical protein [Chloroflexota bacterium]
MTEVRKDALIAAGKDVTTRYLRQRLNIPFDPNFSATPPTPADLANQHALDILGR